MKSKLELTKDALIDEFNNAPYTREFPLGNAATSRKIQEYLIACVEAEEKGMWDWFETNIIKEFSVIGIDRGVLEFARDVLVRYKSNHIIN